MLDELDSFHHAEVLRLGLLAAALALVDPQLDLVDEAQADGADLRFARSRLSGVGRGTITGLACGLLQPLDIVRTQPWPIDVQRNVAMAAEAAAQRGSEGAGEYVRISVIDTGEGMRKEVMDRAFEPFFTTKGEGRGTGLGLSSVLNFAKQSGGFATLESREQGGTTVNLFLPRASAEKGVATRVLSELPYGDGELILVVEDDRKVREVTLKRVEALGYAVEEACSGMEAMDMLKKHPDIRVVLSDIVMPGGMTGVELARQIRRLNENVKIVLSTGYSGGVSVDDQELRETEVLEKPYTREQLANALANALARDVSKRRRDELAVHVE